MVVAKDQLSARQRRLEIGQRAAFEGLKRMAADFSFNGVTLIDLVESEDLRDVVDGQMLKEARARRGVRVERKTKAELAELAQEYFGLDREETPLVMLCGFREMGAMRVSGATLQQLLPVLLELDGDTVFGKWGVEMFSFDFDSDLGDQGYSFYRCNSDSGAPHREKET